MPEPLKATKLPDDFRTIDGRPETVNRLTALAIRQARHYQQLLADLTDEDDDLHIPYGIPDATENDTPQSLAARERNRLGVTVLNQIGWKQGTSFRIWRDKLEALGVCVYVLDFPLNDCRGFSLRESKNPVIAISKEELLDGAKIFTLFHEYCHIIKNLPGISNLNNTNRVEKFCNDFAANFLMPAEALKTTLGVSDPPTARDWDIDIIRKAAKTLHVSQQALALRLENAGYAPKGFFDEVCAKQPKSRDGRKSEGKMAIPPDVRRLSELGSSYASATLTAYDRGSLNDLDAFRMLRLSPKHFDGLRLRLKGRSPYHGAN
jgi:Zn-dependent peptidase ImmA (M78 family)